MAEAQLAAGADLDALGALPAGSFDNAVEAAGVHDPQLAVIAADKVSVMQGDMRIVEMDLAVPAATDAQALPARQPLALALLQLAVPAEPLDDDQRFHSMPSRKRRPSASALS